MSFLRGSSCSYDFGCGVACHLHGLHYPLHCDLDFDSCPDLFDLDFDLRCDAQLHGTTQTGHASLSASETVERWIVWANEILTDLFLSMTWPASGCPIDRVKEEIRPSIVTAGQVLAARLVVDNSFSFASSNESG